MNLWDRLLLAWLRVAGAWQPRLRRRERFTRTFLSNYWRGTESRSGMGSSLTQTAVVRAALPTLCKEFSVQSMLDVPCGDFHWMQHVELPGVHYLGADIVPSLIATNQRSHGTRSRQFIVLDIVADIPPCVDLVICRDLLVHLSEAEIRCALANIKRSGSRLLLTTSFDARDHNVDLEGSDWRPLNLRRPPFSWPAPMQRIVEGCTEEGGDYADKGLSLWRIADLP
jgi:SAM-dependent methyltransferase